MHARGLILAAIGGLALTIDIPLIRLAEGEKWSILMLRTGATFLAGLLIWTVWRMMTPRAPHLVPGRAGAAVAACYGLGAIAFITSVFNTSTANVVFILAFTTMFSALFSWIFLGERPRPATLLAMAVMVGGVLLIVGDSIGTGNLFGDFIALCSSAMVAAAITISRASGKDMGFTPMIGVILPFLVAVAIVSGSSGYQVSAPWWILLDGAVVIPLSFFCLATGPKYISGPEVAMFYLLETVLAPIWVWMIFAETPTQNSLFGGSILIAALVAHSAWQLLGERRTATAVVRQTG